jgi:hypothetical protein
MANHHLSTPPEDTLPVPTTLSGGPFYSVSGNRQLFRAQHESAFLFSLMGIGLLPGGVRFQLWQCGYAHVTRPIHSTFKNEYVS